MSEAAHQSPSDILRPGNIIELADIRELAAFEDLVAAEVDPNYDAKIWAGRTPLSELIRPKKPFEFYGTIADIKLEVMDEPYDRLLDARQRGWIIPGGGRFQLTSRFAAELIPRYRGFSLTADPKSTRPGSLGQIQAELWYYPLPIYARKRGSVSVRHDYHGVTIRRVVTKPKIETEKLIVHNAVARKMGISVLREAMTSPISARDF